MLVKVHMLGFCRPGTIRNVAIPDRLPRASQPIPALLAQVFYYGQNETQPIPNTPSVSIGDVVEHDGRYYLCDRIGWTPLDRTQFEQLLRTKRSTWDDADSTSSEELQAASDLLDRFQAGKPSKGT